MLLIDFNQVVISNFMQQVGAHTNVPLGEDILRHMILNTIRLNKQKFAKEDEEIIICCDSKKYWRRDVFPYYKAGRKKDREASGVDWNTMFNTLSLVRDELIETFPYKTILVDGAEADDIIATLCKKYQDEKIMIVSGDKDFIQLHKYNNVRQYSPITKKHVNGVDPVVYIKEHVLKGDRSDGIPNVLSPDHTFTDELRQRPLTSKRIESILAQEIDELDDEVKRNYQRNNKKLHKRIWCQKS